MVEGHGVYAEGMSIYVGIAMVLVFVAGRKSVKGRRLTKVTNLTDYRIDMSYSEDGQTLTINEVVLDE